MGFIYYKWYYMYPYYYTEYCICIKKEAPCAQYISNIDE